MKRISILRWVWERRLLFSLHCLIGSVIWYVVNVQYLKGLAEGINTDSAEPVKKVENILDWLEYRSGLVGDSAEPIRNQRDVIGILSGKQFLRVCGTASFAFVNIASESGLRSKRLMLMGPKDEAKHVVSEVLLDNKWAVVDPAFTTLLRDEKANLLTKEELKRPEILQVATREIPNYEGRYTYENPTHIRLENIPWAGKVLRKWLDRSFTDWEENLESVISIFNLNSSILAFISFILVLVFIPGSPRPRAQLPVI